LFSTTSSQLNQLAAAAAVVVAANELSLINESATNNSHFWSPNNTINALNNKNNQNQSIAAATALQNMNGMSLGGHHQSLASSYDTWQYYQQQANNQIISNNGMGAGLNNGYMYDGCWNRPVDMASIYTNQPYHYANSLGKKNKR
jgi:hypothetical protein